MFELWTTDSDQRVVATAETLADMHKHTKEAGEGKFLIRKVVGEVVNETVPSKQRSTFNSFSQREKGDNGTE